MFTIALEGMRFNAPVGLYAEEGLLGNEIMVDLYLNLNGNHVKAEELHKSVNYEIVYESVRHLLTQRASLLETVSSKIISTVAALSPKIEGIEVRVSKFNPPVAGRIDRVFVEEAWVRAI